MSNHHSRSQEILEVALSLAEDHGIASVTTVALARRIGFTEAALYRYYPGKTAILAAALQHLAERLFATMLIELAPADAGDLAGIEGQLTRHIRRFTSRRGLLLELMMYAASSRAEPLLQAGDAALQEYSQRMTVFFAQAAALLPDLRAVDAEALARLWVCQLLGGFARCQLGREPWIPEQLPGFTAFIAQLFRHEPGPPLDA